MGRIGGEGRVPCTEQTGREREADRDAGSENNATNIE
jgi:hypothetical protein